MNDNNPTIGAVSGGGGIIAVIVAAGIALVVLLSVFVDDIFTPPGNRAMDVEPGLPQVDTPAG